MRWRTPSTTSIAYADPVGRKSVALALACLFAGCRSEYLITQRSADALAALPPGDRQHAAVPAVDDYQHPHLLVAEGLRFKGGDHPPGHVRVSLPIRERNRPLRIAGIVIAFAGLASQIAGIAALGATAPDGNGIEAAGIIGISFGVGGYLGVNGAVFSLIGGGGYPAEVKPNQPGIVYLPQ